jgi:hypothetical protein
LAEPADEAVEAVRAPCLQSIAHAFLGRRGGVSQGAVAGLNVGIGSGDDPEAIAENRRRAIAIVAPGHQLVTAYQVHSAQCVIVSNPWGDADRPHADALVTDRPGIVLGILTADCAPVLLADREAGVVGAAHAGWKGAIGGITDAIVEAMEQLGAHRARIAAVVGPCIAQASYEVDNGFQTRFLDEDPNNLVWFEAGRAGHWQFDLEGYVAARLRAAGVGQVERLGLDTYGAPGRFFSYRRACHQGEASYGRQISLIAIG